MSWHTILEDETGGTVADCGHHPFTSAGDWIIRGVKGEYYPCKPDIFAETYEAAD